MRVPFSVLSALLSYLPVTRRSRDFKDVNVNTDRIFVSLRLEEPLR
jgi:hypothetical protein